MESACDWHDEAYLNNKARGSETLREAIDKEFLKRMLAIADTKNVFLRPLYKAQAHLYYKLARRFGSYAWNDKSNAN